MQPPSIRRKFERRHLLFKGFVKRLEIRPPSLWSGFVKRLEIRPPATRTCRGSVRWLWKGPTICNCFFKEAWYTTFYWRGCECNLLIYVEVMWRGWEYGLLHDTVRKKNKPESAFAPPPPPPPSMSVAGGVNSYCQFALKKGAAQLQRGVGGGGGHFTVLPYWFDEKNSYWNVAFACRIESGCTEPVFVNVYGAQKSILPAYVAWRAGTTNRVAVPARHSRNRFLGSLKGLHIRAQYTVYCIVCIGSLHSVHFEMKEIQRSLVWVVHSTLITRLRRI